MERRIELEELRELLAAKKYTNIRQFLAELNEADIAFLMEELEEEERLKVYRILPKDLAADVFPIWNSTARRRSSIPCPTERRAM